MRVADHAPARATSAEGYSIDLVSAEPPPGTPLLRGASVPFKVTVNYSLDVAPHGLTTTTGEITLRYPIASSFSGPQYMPYPLADITAAQWEDYHRLVAETFIASRREFPDEHLEVFHSPDSTLHLAFTATGHPAHPARITREAQDGSVDQMLDEADEP